MQDVLGPSLMTTKFRGRTLLVSFPPHLALLGVSVHEPVKAPFEPHLSSFIFLLLPLSLT